MNIKKIYQDSKKNSLFNYSNNFSILRKNIIKNFEISPKIKKNNESLKHLDPNFLKLSYKYISSSNKISWLYHNDDSIKINVLNGKISEVYKNNNNEIDIKIKNIDSNDNAIEKKLLNFQKYFVNDYIFNLNSLLLNSGYEIIIGKKQKVKILISNSINTNDLTIFQKNIISCSDDSEVSIIEEYTENIKSNNNIVNFVDTGQNSNISHFIFQKNAKKSDLQLSSVTNCKFNSGYKQFILNISNCSVRNHHYANLLGDSASAELDGIFFGSNNQFIDNKTQINHIFPNCNSSQRYKGILTDSANASYLSKTHVAKLAQKTEAYQLSKGILLSDNSYFHSKPELKIYADDVKCSHGSTIGPIDEELLFYLRSRGLNKKKSTSLLIKSFFHDIISSIGDKIFVEKFNYHSNEWLSHNNI